MNSRDNFVYFLIGAGIGAALGVLYAPKSGADTRAFLQSKADEGSDAVTNTAQSAWEKVDRVKNAAADGLERGKKAVRDFKDSDTLTAAVEVGKQIYREAQEGGFEN